jgi:trk system potassium uptake protein TrkH
LKTRSSFFVVLNILSVLVSLFGLTFALPLGFAYFESITIEGHSRAFEAFARAAGITLGVGLLGLWLTRGASRDIKPRDGFLLAVMVWFVLAFFAALPIWFYLPELRFSQTFFEAISALTTTGATALSGLDEMSRAVLVWRSFLQWLGGMGIIILAVAILPLLGVGGMQLFKVEISGPSKDSKLTPRITETAQGLWGIYLLFSLLCFFAYWIAGMDWFDALVHMGSTVSIGGMSSHDASIGYFDSPWIEAVAIVFMVLSGINFAIHFSAMRRMSTQPYRDCPEARYYVLTLALGVVFVALVLWLRDVYPSLSEAFRVAAFNVVAIVTTTGFATEDYSQWPHFVPWLMIFLCAFATSSGSTGGGIKMIRLVIMVKLAYREFLRIIHPRVVQPVQLGRSTVASSVVFAVLAYMLAYGATVMVTTFLLLLSGMNDITAISAALACVNNLGPGLNEVGPAGNYGGLTGFQLWVLSFAMLLGRLELLTVLVILIPAFWRK